MTNQTNDDRRADARWLSDYSDYLTSLDLSPRTLQAYLGDLQLYAEWYGCRYGQDFQPSALVASDLRAYKRFLIEDRRLKPSSINRRLAAQRVFNRWAQAAGLLAIDAAENVDLLPEPSPAPRWLEKRQAHRLLAEYERAVNANFAADRPGRYRQALAQRAIAMLQRGAGLRTSEALALDLDDLQLAERSGWVIVRQGKGGKYARLPLPLETRQALSDWLAVRGHDDGALFPSQKGGRLGARQVQRYFQEMLRRAGIDGDFTPHSWRHTYVRRLVADPQVPLAEARQLARHSRPEMTLRYAMAGAQQLQDAVERGMAA